MFDAQVFKLSWFYVLQRTPTQVLSSKSGFPENRSRKSYSKLLEVKNPASSQKKVKNAITSYFKNESSEKMKPKNSLHILLYCLVKKKSSTNSGRKIGDLFAYLQGNFGLEK